MTFYPYLLIFSLLGSLTAFATPDPKTTPSNDALHTSWIDTSISPAQDFYKYANGNWQKQNPIPAEYASWGTFNILNEKVLNQIHQMLKKAASNTKAKLGSIDQKVGDFYYSGMDEESINKLGVSPLAPQFKAIDSIRSLTDLQTELIQLHQIGVDALFGFGSMQDFHNSKLMIGALSQSGLSLPNKDYYLKKDAKFQKIREAYVNHVGAMMHLLGESPEQAAKDAQTILTIETQLAKVSMSPIEQRDPKAVYHLMTLQDLDKVTPNFNWPHYFKAYDKKTIGQINLAMPHFFKELNELLKTVPLDNWKTYLRWHLLDDYAPYLSQPFIDENFKMITALSGTEKILPRWKRVVSVESAALGFAIGKMYVDQYFSAQSKEAVLELLKNIRTVLQQDMNTLSWMTPNTRRAALKKLELMEERIGYPSKWWDYSSLIIDRGPYVLNVMRANHFLVKRDLNKIGKPIDRTEWSMTPQTINAYYDPSMNNLNIPAGILVPPFFDLNAPAAINYGAIGFVMGHEMTHGFDDQGAKFDGQGNLNDWWTASDLAKFNQATLCIVNQFSKYKVDGDLPVQGKLVVGEATADLGGLTLAYKAFRLSKAYQQAKTIEGFTPDQQFFLGAAHVWATNVRPQQIRNQVTTDPHPPAQFRVNGSFANSPEFQKAFQIPDNSPMVNNTRCVIW